MTPEFKERFEKFLEKAQARINEHYAKNFPDLLARCDNQRGILRYTVGPKYIRVTSDSSAYCFIDLETGRIWKPKGYKGPEKKNPRGCIFDSDYGLNGVTVYGTTYLR